MQTFSTYIEAICAETGDLVTFSGQPIEAISKGFAHSYCQNNGLGYLHIGDPILYEQDMDGNVEYFENISKN